MEIRKLEIDYEAGVLKINGKDFTEKPIVVTLPGPAGWPLGRMFNGEKATEGLKECSKLIVSFIEDGPVRISLEERVADLERQVQSQLKVNIDIDTIRRALQKLETRTRFSIDGKPISHSESRD